MTESVELHFVIWQKIHAEGRIIYVSIRQKCTLDSLSEKYVCIKWSSHSAPMSRNDWAKNSEGILKELLFWPEKTDSFGIISENFKNFATVCSSLQTFDRRWWIPSAIYSWFLKPLSVLHSRFPTKKSWIVAYFWPQHFF